MSSVEIHHYISFAGCPIPALTIHCKATSSLYVFEEGEAVGDVDYEDCSRDCGIH